MAFELASAATADGFRIEAHDSVGSTNQLALEHARAGDAGRLWIVARRQEAGRGRRGRPWATPEGNLAATLLMVGAGELRLAATLGFVAGLSLADALDAVVPVGRIAIAADAGASGRDRFALKWPNDVLAGGAKLAGILLESTLLADGRQALAVGIGVNVVSYPQDVPYPATSLAALGVTATAEDLFRALSESWTRNARDWDEGRGLATVRRRWLARAAGLGAEAAVRVEGTVMRGVFETIDEYCHFLLRTEDGALVRIAAGDVHFGAVASAAAV